MKVRRKSVVLEAVQWFPGVQITGVEEFGEPLFERSSETLPRARLQALEGPLIISPGYWVITGLMGEIYAVHPALFDTLYERVYGHCVDCEDK